VSICGSFLLARKLTLGPEATDVPGYVNAEIKLSTSDHYPDGLSPKEKPNRRQQKDDVVVWFWLGADDHFCSSRS
jgi:hypothetical protein